MTSTKTKKGKIAFVMDERLPRERVQALMAKIGAIRHDVEVHSIRGDTPDASLFKDFEKNHYQAIFGPWYRYFNWKKLETILGITRTKGTAVVGYMAEPVDLDQLPEARPDLNRMILLDFVKMSKGEIRRIVSCLTNEDRRSGIRPLLEPGTTIYTENWMNRIDIGEKIDVVSSLPELVGTEWEFRLTEIRVAMLALWNMIYEEGPGKGELAASMSGSKPRAHLQIGLDGTCLVMRLCFRTGGFKAQESIRSFWPNTDSPVHAIPLLARFTDLVRIHTISETPGVEILAVLLKSSPAVRAPHQVHNIWIEPISERLFVESPAATPSPKTPHLKLFPVNKSKNILALEDDTTVVAENRDRLLVKANIQIQELKNQLVEKEETIKDLKMGGVGTAFEAPEMDPSSHFDTFKEAFFNAHHRLRQYELELNLLKQNHADDFKIQELASKVATMSQQEKEWLQELEELLALGKGATRTSGRAA